MDIQIDTARPVLVTGATGYVAGWLVKRLLDAGITVHAAVRDPDESKKLQHLNAIADTAPGRIEYFKSDLLQDGSYAEAMKGCGIVFHTASPFTSAVEDPQRDLIDPAVNGTRNVLQQASRTDGVQRVVLTSSVAAIYTDAIECRNAPGGTLTEDIWNTTASLDYQPYSYSKTLAEREAWEISTSQSKWDLVVVNPSLVMGPAIGGRPSSESFRIVERAGSGEFRTGAPRLSMGMVDVREVADAHVAAAFNPAAAGRHIVSGHDTTIYDALRLLVPRFGDRYPLPTRAVPKPLIWLVAPWIGLDRRFIARNVGHPFRADNSKSKRELGITYRPLKASMEEMFQYMIDVGYFTE